MSNDTTYYAEDQTGHTPIRCPKCGARPKIVVYCEAKSAEGCMKRLSTSPMSGGDFFVRDDLFREHLHIACSCGFLSISDTLDTPLALRNASEARHR